MDDGEYRYFTVRESGALSVVQFRLAITAPSTVSDHVQKEITEFVARNDCQKLVFDLSATAYLPSNVIGILAVLSVRGVEVHLANASADIVNVMEVMGLNKRIHVNKYALEAAGTEAATTSSPRVPTSVVDGYFVLCPVCESRQRIDKHLLGKSAKCTNCYSPVHVNSELLQAATHVYCTCPACEREVKLPAELPVKAVKCGYCDGKFQVRKVL